MRERLIQYVLDGLLVILIASVLIWFLIKSPVFHQPNVLIAPDIRIARLKNQAELLNQYAPRTVSSGLLNATARHLHQELSHFTTPYYQPFHTLKGRFSNVVVQFGPKASPTVVIGTRYDASRDEFGRDANTSGLTVWLELARQLSEYEEQLNVTVELVAYPLSRNTEDKEDMGSYHHALKLEQEGRQVDLILTLDNVGQFIPQQTTQSYPYDFMRWLYPDSGDYLALLSRPRDVLRVRRVKQYFQDMPVETFNTVTGFSEWLSADYLNYQQQGFTTVLLTDTGKYREVTGRNVAHAAKTEHADMMSSSLFNYQRMSQLVASLLNLSLSHHFDSDNSDRQLRFTQREYGRNARALLEKLLPDMN